MSYRCQACNVSVPHSTARQIHVIYRADTKQIAREIPVCADCKQFLSLGGRMEDIRRKPQMVKIRRQQVKQDHKPAPAADNRPIGPHVPGLGTVLNPSFFTFQPRARRHTTKV